jgi:hypothetical protein
MARLLETGNGDPGLDGLDMVTFFGFLSHWRLWCGTGKPFQAGATVSGTKRPGRCPRPRAAGEKTLAGNRLPWPSWPSEVLFRPQRQAIRPERLRNRRSAMSLTPYGGVQTLTRSGWPGQKRQKNRKKNPSCLILTIFDAIIASKTRPLLVFSSRMCEGIEKPQSRLTLSG